MKRVFGLLFVIALSTPVFSQDTLPKFTVAEKGKKVIVSWINPYESCIQLNVQRSYDSLKYFRTVYSANSPGLPQNGFSETKPAYSKTFYRIFYVLEGGAYFFTPAKLATPDFEARSININVDDKVLPSIKNITISARGIPVKLVSAPLFTRFRDSILKQTKDTLFAVNDSLVELRRFVPKEIWKPSLYIFTNKDGYLNISLTDAKSKKYHLKFFEEDGTSLFEIHQVKEPLFTLDKSNFVHAGWYVFELFEDDKLKEKNKFYLPKDF
ncbi:MAG: hypothetical protein LH478_16025 [Chitinophagaceae bacterium]|nr:hypothetical protein [Chitinophagaceae bacterium]